MRTTLAIAFTALITASGVPAFAASYEEAKADAVPPTTGEAMASCAHRWDTWARSLNPNHFGEGKGIWDESWLAKRHPDIQLPAARETANYWAARSEEQYKAEGNPGGYDAFKAEATNWDIEMLDNRTFYEWLGACARLD